MLVTSTQGINRLEYLQICKQTRLPGTCSLKQDTPCPLCLLRGREKEKQIDTNEGIKNNYIKKQKKIKKIIKCKKIKKKTSIVN